MLHIVLYNMLDTYALRYLIYWHEWHDFSESTSDVVEGKYGSANTRLIYGVFTTPTNSIGGSAICAFSMDAIMKTFDGPFKEQATMNSNWLKVSPSKVSLTGLK